MTIQIKSDKDRLLENIEINPDTNCWEWQGKLQNPGKRNQPAYGYFKIAGKQLNSHRASWIIHNGAIPTNQAVRHTCKVAHCCNPAHLYVGAPKGTENIESIKTRFQALYKVNEANHCWEWFTGPTKLRSNGRSQYGNFSFHGKTYNAHRASWIIHRGAIPDGLHVLHKCDVTYCCNPEHLFLGTHRENMLDKVAKGRQGKVGPRKKGSAQ